MANEEGAGIKGREGKQLFPSLPHPFPFPLPSFFLPPQFPLGPTHPPLDLSEAGSSDPPTPLFLSPQGPDDEIELLQLKLEQLKEAETVRPTGGATLLFPARTSVARAGRERELERTFLFPSVRPPPTPWAPAQLTMAPVIRTARFLARKRDEAAKQSLN